LPAGASAPTRRPTPCPASSAPARRSVSSASGLLRAHPPVDQPPARLLAGLCPPPSAMVGKVGVELRVELPFSSSAPAKPC
jgi:hypothetical protein